jgi:hypothetical protein
MTTATTGKVIEYVDGEYDMYFDGAYIGSRGTRHEAEQALDAHAYSLISRGNRRPAEAAPMVAVDDDVPTPIRVDVILDALVDAYDEALLKTADDSRWHNAVTSAFDWLLQQDVLDYADGVLTVQSATSDAVYHASPTTCQCAAFTRGNPCWHRAAARIVQIAVDGK